MKSTMIASLRPSIPLLIAAALLVAASVGYAYSHQWEYHSGYRGLLMIRINRWTDKTQVYNRVTGLWADKE